MAILKNVEIQRTDAQTLTKGTSAQATAGANGAYQAGAFRYNTENNEVHYHTGGQLVNPVPRTATTPKTFVRPQNLAANYPGISAANPATSAVEILKYYPAAPDGVYWINLPAVGARQVYCVMDARYAGGGWMMAMKATRGGTFTYGASYWTSTNTLNDNTSYYNRADQDFKGEVFNRYPAKDLLAYFPDLGNGGSLNVGAWTWFQPNFYNGQPRGSTFSGQVHSGGVGGYSGGSMSSGGLSGGVRTELVTLFNRVNRYFIQDADTFSGGPGYGQFSSQVDIRFYGFNWNDNLNSRWGFGYNENGGGLYPYGAEGSDDLVGGLGTNYHSAGDQINCCQNRTGVNRSMRVELYVR